MSGAKRRLVVACGGAQETAQIPSHLLRLATWGELFARIDVVLSPGAEAFLSETAVQGITGHPVYTARQPFSPESGAPFHIDLAKADYLVMYPATARIVASLALGLIACPVTRVFAFAPKTNVIVTPYLHPAMDDRLYTPHLDRLKDLGCRVVRPGDGSLAWTEENAWLATEDALFQEMGVPRIYRPPPTVGRVSG